jgi:large subunit ribosomal protein L10
MASSKILAGKQEIIDEITQKLKDSESVILFRYAESTVDDLQTLRRELNKIDSSMKIYKNTLVKRSLNSMDINLDDILEGPNAIVFGKELLEPIKAIADFAKNHEAAVIRVGIISGEVADLDVINKYATIPSRETLLTQLASGMMAYVRDLSIALDLYADKKEN